MLFRSPTRGAEPRQNRAGYRTDVGACDGCPFRSQCTSATKPNGYKFVTKNLSLPAAREAMELFSQLRAAEPNPPPARRAGHASGPGGAKPIPATTRETTTKILQFPDVPAPVGFRWERPRFRPREARRQAREFALAGLVTIKIVEDAEPAPTHPLLHRPGHTSMPAMKSGPRRLQTYALPDGWSATILVTRPK